MSNSDQLSDQIFSEEEDHKDNILLLDSEVQNIENSNRSYYDHVHTNNTRNVPDNEELKTFYPYWKREDEDTKPCLQNAEYLQNNERLPYLNDDIILCPPSSSSHQYNYAPLQRNMPARPAQAYNHSNYNHAPQHHSHYAAHPPPVPVPAQHPLHSSHHPPQATPPHGYAHHPNMWYPNTPGAYWTGYGNRNYAHDSMDSMLQLSNSGREARNRAEKNRRDKLNSSIQELSTMVPHVAESPRRVDKTAVLRFAAHGLRCRYTFGDSRGAEHRISSNVSDALMKLLDCIFLTLTCHGQIVLISPSVEQHLGHCQADLYGQSILHITHPEDHNTMKQQLIPTDLENLFEMQTEDGSEEPRARTALEEEYIDKRLRQDKRSFTVRFARAGPRSESTTYEVVKIDGCFRRSDMAPRGTKTSTFPSSLQLIRRSRGRENTIPLHCISGNDIMLVAVARIIRPPRIVNQISEASKMEYKTRHLIDGRIIDCDQRIGIVAGYMTNEVQNLSPFTFMHQDDVRWVIVALRQMYDCNSSYGESTYRLITRNGNFIYLQSKGYLEIDKDTNKVHSFICINTLLDEEEGKRRIEEMKNKFSVIIKTKIPHNSIDALASDNPVQLEKAVMCLIQNLQNSNNNSDYNPLSPSTSTTSRKQTCQITEIKTSSSGSSKTPPLALIPPEPSSVKNSIQQSVNVVNITAAKNFRENQQRCRLSSTTKETATATDCEDEERNVDEEDDDDDDGVGDGDYMENNNELIAVGTKRSLSCTESAEDVATPKRRLNNLDIEHALNSSLNQVRRSLVKQLDELDELRNQSNIYEVPNSSQRIDEMMEEHQIQSEMFNNIQSQYDIQLLQQQHQEEQQQHNKDIEPNSTKSLDYNNKDGSSSDQLEPTTDPNSN